jgi:hypothetical protein
MAQPLKQDGGERSSLLAGKGRGCAATVDKMHRQLAVCQEYSKILIPVLGRRSDNCNFVWFGTTGDDQFTRPAERFDHFVFGCGANDRALRRRFLRLENWTNGAALGPVQLFLERLNRMPLDRCAPGQGAKQPPPAGSHEDESAHGLRFFNRNREGRLIKQGVWHWIEAVEQRGLPAKRPVNEEQLMIYRCSAAKP